jgi:hypothetical protein
METTQIRLRSVEDQGSIWRSPVALAKFVGFIVLFSALMAGYTFVDAGHEKWGNPAWTGSASGAAIDGFLQGANYKSVESPTNPYPEVSPLVRDANERLFSQHTEIFSWLTMAAEVLLPLAVITLIVVRFRRSRALLVAVTMLATSLNVLYLTEGDSGENPPMLFMWLAIIWLAVLWPSAALSYAVDLGAPAQRAHTPEDITGESGIGLWLFFGTVLLVVVAGSLEMYWDQLGTFAALAAVTVALAAALTLIERRLSDSPVRRAMRPMTVEPDGI